MPGIARRGGECYPRHLSDDSIGSVHNFGNRTDQRALQEKEDGWVSSRTSQNEPPSTILAYVART